MQRKTYIVKRIALGLFAMIATSISLAFLPPLFSFSFESNQFFVSQPLPTIEESLKMAIAAFVGAYVARVPFVTTMIIYYIATSLYSSYILMLIAEPLEPVSIFEVIARNAIGFAAGLLMAVAGADLGYRMRGRAPDAQDAYQTARP